MYYSNSKKGDIQYQKNPGSSWSAFFKKVSAVKSEKGAESFVDPPTVNTLIKTLLVNAHLCLPCATLFYLHVYMPR